MNFDCIRRHRKFQIRCEPNFSQISCDILEDFIQRIRSCLTEALIVKQDERALAAVVGIACSLKLDAVLLFLSLLELNDDLKTSTEGLQFVPFFLDPCEAGVMRAHFQKRNETKAFLVLPNIEGESPTSILLHNLRFEKVVELVVSKNWTLYVWQENVSNLSELPSLISYPRLAYIATTSGTTGEPQLVHVPVDSIMKNVDEFVFGQTINLSEKDSLLSVSPLTFDPALLDILCALTAGAVLILPEENTVRDPAKLGQVILESKPTFLQITPTLLFDYGAPHLVQAIQSVSETFRFLLLGGETVGSMESVIPLFTENLQVFNVYGTTEHSCWAFLHPIARDDPSSLRCLGEPLRGTEFSLERLEGDVLQRRKNTSLWSLMLGGQGRRCYVGPEDPLMDGTSSQFRCTGDIVSKQADCTRLFYEGRSDFIVKRFGKKVSLHHLEDFVLQTFSFCRRVVSSVSDGRTLTLQIYLKEAEECMLDIPTLRKKVRKQLQQDLGDCYVPDALYISKPLDMTDTLGRSFKFRRKCLDVTSVISQLWLDFLGGTECKGNFIRDGGGSSFLAVAFVGELEEVLDRKLPELLDLLLRRNFSDVLDFFGMSRSVADSQTKRPRLEETSSPSISCQNLEKGRKVLWRVSLRACIDASPTVDQGGQRVFLGSHAGRVSCYSLREGRPFWEHEVNGRIMADVCLCWQEQVAIVSCYSGWLYAFDAKTGKELGTQDVGSPVSTTPTIVESKAGGVQMFVTTHDRRLLALEVLLSATDGSVSYCIKWQLDLTARINSKIQMHPNPSRLVFADVTGSVKCLQTEDGRQLWLHRSAEAEAIFADPLSLMDANATLFVGVKGTVFKLCNANGSLLWSRSVSGNVFGRPLLVASTLVVVATQSKELLGILESDGSCLWKVQLPGPVSTASPCFSSRTGIIVVGDTEGCLTFLKVLGAWDTPVVNALPNIQLPAPIFSSPKFVDNVLLVGCRDDHLYAFDFSDVASLDNSSDIDTATRSIR